MQIGLENDSEFEEEVKGDSFKIMMAMKLKIHDPSKVQCPHVTLFEHLERLLSTDQEEEEPLVEHTKRFEQAQDNVDRTEQLCKNHGKCRTTCQQDRK